MGVLLNLIFPDWLVLVLLIVTLIITAYRTTQKGINLWKQETARKNKSKHSESNQEVSMDVYTLMANYDEETAEETQSGLMINGNSLFREKLD